MKDTLGSRIRTAVAASGLTQRKVAEKTGVDESAVSRYVRDHQAPSADYLARFISVTGVDGHWLLTGEGSPKRADPVVSVRMLDSVMDALASEGDEAAKLLAAARNRHLLRAQGIVQSLAETQTEPQEKGSTGE